MLGFRSSLLDTGSGAGVLASKFTDSRIFYLMEACLSWAPIEFHFDHAPQPWSRRFPMDPPPRLQYLGYPPFLGSPRLLIEIGEGAESNRPRRDVPRDRTGVNTGASRTLFIFDESISFSGGI